MNRSEAEELLPWFVAGTLSDDETRAVQAFIDNGEISQADIDELALFANTVAEVPADEPDYNRRILKDVVAQLDSVAQQSPQEPLVVGEVGEEISSQNAPSLWQRFSDLLDWAATPLSARWVMGAQMAAVLGLAIMVALPASQAPDSEFGTVSGSTSTGIAADLTIAFAPSTTEQVMRQLLVAHDVSIVAGPDSLGMYKIAAADGVDLDTLAQMLSADPNTTFVQPIAD